MEEISAASKEQSQGIHQVTVAVAEMDAITRQNAGLVRQAAHAALHQLEQIEGLREVIARFAIPDDIAEGCEKDSGAVPRLSASPSAGPDRSAAVSWLAGQPAA